MQVEIGNETTLLGEIKHGHTDVGTTVAALTNLSFSCQRGILVRAPGPGEDDANSDIVYCGRAAVTANSNAKTGGFPIIPGGCLVLPVDDPSKVYVISPSSGQTLAWMGV